MATGQNILDLMEDMHPELQLQSGESNAPRGLRLLNAAQDVFETVIAQYPDVLGGTIGTITTTASTESTTFPTGVMRLDSLWFVDAGTSLPSYPLETLQEVGGHSWHRQWPHHLVTSTTTGKPRSYWTDGSKIYWDPLPSGTHTVRYYGFKSADDITASGTFSYPGAAMFPLAVFAVRMARTGVDDPVDDYTALAATLFTPLVESLTRFHRVRARGYQYQYSHET
jgi:hypothetical protein